MIRTLLLSLFVIFPTWAQETPPNQNLVNPLAAGYSLTVAVGDTTYNLVGLPNQYVRMVQAVEGVQLAYHLPSDTVYVKTPFIPQLIQVRGADVRGRRTAIVRAEHAGVAPTTTEGAPAPQVQHKFIIANHNGRGLCNQGVGRTDYAQHTGLSVPHLMTLLNTLHFVLEGKTAPCVFGTYTFQAVNTQGRLLPAIIAQPLLPQSMTTYEGTFSLKQLAPAPQAAFTPPTDALPLTAELRAHLKKSPQAGAVDENGNPLSAADVLKILTGQGPKEPAFVSNPLF